MNYRVFWSPDAELQLEKILKDPANQVRLAAAARVIDKQLVTDPLEFGESRYDTLRIGFERPLGVLYEVIDDVATVIVYEVWRIE